MAVTKNGVSAASLQPQLGLGSYETARAMCHKLRTAWDGPPSLSVSCETSRASGFGLEGMSGDEP